MRGFIVLTALSASLLLAVGCDRRVGLSGSPGADSSHAMASVSDADVADADNSAVNVRDRDGSIPTPLDQGQNQDDINITATIRKRVVEQPFSLNGHNVKIITQSGKVTLRGPVNSDLEKRQIEAIASQVAGAEKVESLLEVDRD